ncbi:odorant receptor 7a-like [Hermetia illucens]|uniref:odorant receptor 7a-like n=1 Tax=Hermetia illucens TaxID=343691 RepID=UPI0018CC29F8|nr:odorant receptor 7a-like [Hermetia illucens]
MRREIIQIRPILEKLDNHSTTETQRSVMTTMAALSGRQHLVYPVWLPYDWHVSPFRFWITWLYQCVAYFFLCFQQASNDVIGPIYLNVLDAHLRIIMQRVEDISNNSWKSDSDMRNEFVGIIEDHRLIMKVFDILQGTVSYTIFLQFIGTSLVICMIILEYFVYNLTATETLTGMLFLLAEIFQIAPCCYYSNQFMSSTDSFVNSIYSLNWTGQSIKFKKLMILFMIFTQRSKVIIAGKVIPVTLATFASILKISYSLFTVASNFSKK